MWDAVITRNGVISNMLVECDVGRFYIINEIERKCISTSNLFYSVFYARSKYFRCIFYYAIFKPFLLPGGLRFSYLS